MLDWAMASGLWVPQSSTDSFQFNYDFVKHKQVWTIYSC